MLAGDNESSTINSAFNLGVIDKSSEKIVYLSELH